jgi:hypothetical protein
LETIGSGGRGESDWKEVDAGVSFRCFNLNELLLSSISIQHNRHDFEIDGGFVVTEQVPGQSEFDHLSWMSMQEHQKRGPSNEISVIIL